jgi:uncharacterized protein YaaQ
MKLIIAIVKDIDNETVSHALTAEKFRVTYVASTGGFLRRGQSTLMIGVEDQQLDKAMEIIRSNVTPASDSDNRRTTIFVLNVNQFTQY